MAAKSKINVTYNKLVGEGVHPKTAALALTHMQMGMPALNVERPIRPTKKNKNLQKRKLADSVKKAKFPKAKMGNLVTEPETDND